MMLLRQRAILTQSGLKLRYDAQSTFLKGCSGLHDLVSSMVGFRPHHMDLALVTQHILHPLWRQGVHVLAPLVTASTWKSLPQIMQSFPHWPPGALRAYSLLLALCCTPAHQFHRQCAADGICPAHASLHLHPAFTDAVQVACAQHILRFVDCSTITAMVVDANCMITMAGLFQHLSGWRRSCRCMSQLQPSVGHALHQSGDHDHNDGMQAYTMQVSLAKDLWPSKLAHFQARHLMNKCHAGFATQQDHLVLLEQQCHSQALFMASPMRSHALVDNVPFIFRDVNPDHNVIATQVAMLTWHDDGIIAVYDQSGRFADSMSLRKLELLSGLHLAAGARIHDLPQHLTLLNTCMAVTRKQNARRYILMHHSSHAADLLDDMVAILELKVHWLATALSCSQSLLCFAAGTSLCAMYSSMTAYDCLWTGHGLVTPSMCTADSYRALDWAIAFAYASEPTRLLLLCHSPNNAACKLMLHPLVYRLASAPPGSMPVSTHVGFTQHMQCTWPSTNSSQMALVLVANAAGLGSLTSIAWEQVQQAIWHCGLDACQTSKPVPRVGPLPRPVSVLKSAKAHQPSPREATCSPDPDCAVLELIIAKPAKRWAGVPALYTDGSKRDSSLSFAWTSPVMSLEKQYKVPGPASCHRTVLQAELMAIHAAIHAEELQGVQAIMTDSLNSIRLVAAHIACTGKLEVPQAQPAPHLNFSEALNMALAHQPDQSQIQRKCLRQPRG